jgi:hypothetical protein
LIAWQFEVPLSAHPERRLRDLLERVEDEELRRRLLSPLEEFEARRGAASPPLPEILTSWIQLSRSWRSISLNLTGLAATRWAGRMYTGRTLVYEDCRRDIEVEIGGDFVDEVIGAARAAVAKARAGSSTKRPSGCAMSFARSTNDWLASREAARLMLPRSAWKCRDVVRRQRDDRFFDEVQEEFRRKWETVLAVSPERATPHLSQRGSAPGSRSNFLLAPRAGWNAALHHSPDLMIAADSVEAIRRGEVRDRFGRTASSQRSRSAAQFFTSSIRRNWNYCAQRNTTCRSRSRFPSFPTTGCRRAFSTRSTPKKITTSSSHPSRSSRSANRQC